MRKHNDWLEAYCAYRKSNEAPDLFHRWIGIWMLSAVVGRRAWLEFEGFNIYPNEYILLVGEPATHKSTAINMGVKLLREVEGVYLGADVTSKEALITKLASFRESFLYQGEEFIHTSLAQPCPEWSMFIGEKNVDMCNWLCRLYDSDDYLDKETKTQGNDSVVNYCFTQLGGVTKGQILTNVPSAAIGGGFTSRILAVVGEEAKEKRNALPFKSGNSNKVKMNLINDLSVIRQNVIGRFKINSSAEKYYKNWYNKDRDEHIIKDEAFVHYYNRKPTHVLKVAMLLSASSAYSNMVITLEEIVKAIKMIDDIEPKMPEAFGGISTSETAEIIYHIYKKVKEWKSIHVTKLSLALWKVANATEFKLAMATMFDRSDVFEYNGEEIVFERKKENLVWRRMRK